jgi:hypothetical protein
MLTKIILNVPFKDKDQVKQLGAKWDPQLKVWYIPHGLNPKAFNNWLPKLSKQPTLILNSISLLRNIITCWSCKGYCTVYALCARNLQILESNEKIPDAQVSKMQEGFYVLLEISHIVDELSDFLSKRCQNFRYGKVNEQGFRFYRNHCEHCAIGFSDTRLHKKAGGFNPVKLSALQSMQCIELQFFSDIEVKSDYIDYSEHKLYTESLVISDYLLDFV